MLCLNNAAEHSRNQQTRSPCSLWANVAKSTIARAIALFKSKKNEKEEKLETLCWLRVQLTGKRFCNIKSLQPRYNKL